jgi:hypothetical protein
VTIVSRDDPPELGVTPSVGVADDVATADHPPRLRVTIANDGDEAVGVGEGRAAFFEYVTSESGSLILLPTAGEADYPAEPDCWRLTEPIAITEEYRTVRVDAGASERRTLSLYGAADDEPDACLPVGQHRFETTISVGPADGIASEGESAQWGFSVLLE